MGKLPCEDWRLQSTTRPRKTPETCVGTIGKVRTFVHLKEHMEIGDGLVVLALPHKADDRGRCNLCDFQALTFLDDTKCLFTATAGRSITHVLTCQQGFHSRSLLCGLLTLLEGLGGRVASEGVHARGLLGRVDAG